MTTKKTEMTDSPSSLTDERLMFQRTGLVIHGSLKYDEWSQLGPDIADLERGLRWALGDWINYGEAEYGQKYAQALENTGLEYGYLANLSWVASKIEISRRREELGMSHHQVVAPLPPEQQDIWLQFAVDEQLNRNDFRKAVRDAMATDDAQRQRDKSRPFSPKKLEGLVLSMLRAKASNKNEVFEDILRELMEGFEEWI